MTSGDRNFVLFISFFRAGTKRGRCWESARKLKVFVGAAGGLDLIARVLQENSFSSENIVGFLKLEFLFSDAGKILSEPRIDIQE